MPSHLTRLTYASTATFESNQSGGVEIEVARILAASRRNNRDLQVGGVLHYGQGYFFQALEGERETVDELYKRITQDPRHRDVKVLSYSDVEERFFADWSMKYVVLEDQIHGMLDRHGISFNPYRFNDDVIDDFLHLCVYGEDPTEQAGGAEQKVDQVGGGGARPLWKRLLGLKQTP